MKRETYVIAHLTVKRLNCILCICDSKCNMQKLPHTYPFFLQFVTMPGSDEKASLIPVLSTILRLSPQEIETVSKAVKAEVNTGEAAGGDVGWSSYLGLWSP